MLNKYWRQVRQVRKAKALRISIHDKKSWTKMHKRGRRGLARMRHLRAAARESTTFYYTTEQWGMLSYICTCKKASTGQPYVCNCGGYK